MNKRLEAIENEEHTYRTGKACKRGHNDERYTSNGACVVCTKMIANSTTALHRVAKGRKNLARAAGLRDYVVNVSPANTKLVDMVCEILQFSNPFAVADLTAVVERLHVACPMPRALNREDLLKFIVLNEQGNIPQSCIDTMSYENDSATGTLYLVHNGYRYLGTEVMEVLRRQRVNVANSGRAENR